MMTITEGLFLSAVHRHWYQWHCGRRR